MEAVAPAILLKFTIGTQQLCSLVMFAQIKSNANSNTDIALLFGAAIMFTLINFANSGV